MTIVEPVRDACRALRVNILRSVLTTLGIIIGVGAVIVMVSVGAGAQEQVADIINSMGADLIYVFPGTTTAARIRQGTGSLPTLTEEDAEAIQKEIVEVEVVAPYIRGRGQIISGNSNWSTTILGVTPEYFEAREWGLENGRSDRGRRFPRQRQDRAARQYGRPEPAARGRPHRLRAARQPGPFQGGGPAAGERVLHGRVGPGRPGPDPHGPGAQEGARADAP